MFVNFLLLLKNVFNTDSNREEKGKVYNIFCFNKIQYGNLCPTKYLNSFLDYFHQSKAQELVLTNYFDVTLILH